MTAKLAIRAQSATHVGLQREANEDAFLDAPDDGLYAVFDGMGGAASGEVASQRARDVVLEFVRARRAQLPPGPLLAAALSHASGAVHAEAAARRDRRGMGTTAVAALLVGPALTIAHVGDSRAYLLRDGRLTQLTQDHTIVAELLARGAIRPEEVEHHAYRSVLSRNLGAKPEVKADVVEVALQPGDRVLLCSDGLYGYASTEAMQQLAGSQESPETVVRQLVELALRGGGGDNVTVIVLDAGVAQLPRATQMLRASGSVAWWVRRDGFLAAVRAAGLAQNPICAVRSPDDTVTSVAGGFADALFHDLEKSTTVNVWSFAEQLARGWLGRGGAWPALRQLLDVLHHGCGKVVDDVRGQDDRLALLLEAAVTRELTIAEMAVGGVLGGQLRALETELVRLHAERQAAAAARAVPPARPATAMPVPPPVPGRPSEAMAAAEPTFTDQHTVPFQRRDRPGEAAPPDVQTVLDAAARAAMRADRDPVVRDLVSRLHQCAVHAGSAGHVEHHAQEVLGGRGVDERATAALFDAADRARRALVTALHAGAAPSAARAGALRQLAVASSRLASAIAALVFAAAAPGAEQLRAATRQTAELRAQVGKNEARLAELERRFATVYDPMAGRIAAEAASPPASRRPAGATVHGPHAGPGARGPGSKRS